MKPLIMALLIVAVLLLASPRSLSAQAQSPANQAEIIQTLLNRIDQLEKRVSQLEGSKEPAAAAAQQAAAPPEMNHGEAIPTTADSPNLKIAGFSDFNFSGSDQPGTKSGFSEGQFILHLNSNLSPKVS